MSWIHDALQSRGQSPQVRPDVVSEQRLEAGEKRVWAELAGGLEHDVEEFIRLDGGAELRQVSDFECRIANPKSGIAVVVTADLPAHAIRYAYEPENEKTAVPEGGVLSLHQSDQAVQLYSADERVTPEQARQLILEPLLFPLSSEELKPAGT